MNLKKIMQNIFSVKNVKFHKVITIMGISFKIFDAKKKILSLEKQQSRMLNYSSQLKTIMDSCVDITQCKKATGLLREVQLTRAKALKLVLNIFKKHNLVSWLDFGTLIGAVRHKGFIPWDDDIDIAMLRSDYIRAYDILAEELKNTELKVDFGGHNRSFLIRITNCKSEFFYLDIFPYDFVNDKELSCEELKNKLMNARDELYSRDKSKLLRLDLASAWEKLRTECMEFYKKFGVCIYDGNDDMNKYNKIVRGIDSMTNAKRHSIHNIENVFPLKRMIWEDIEVNIPNDSMKYLSECDEGNYGDVMKFPSIDATVRHKYSGIIENEEFELKQIKQKSDYLDNLMLKLK